MSVRIATLMCVYAGDSEELFREALRSILEQRLDPSIESRVYLGVDGQVSAALEHVIEEHADQLFITLRSEVNRGLARTLNALIARLTEEDFIFRMDADDVSLPERYQAQIDHLLAHPEIDILGTAITEIDVTSGEQRKVSFCVGPKDAADNIHRRVPVAHPTVCFRSGVLRTVRGYPVVGTNEDVALWFECLRLGFRFDNLPQSLLHFRISEGFWKRRSYAKSRSEFMCYLRGIYAIDGPFTLKYVFPFLRLCVRLSPIFVNRWAYRSSFRLGGDAP